MQRHQQWIDNRQYQHHLASLISIKKKTTNFSAIEKCFRENNPKSACNNKRKQNYDDHVFQQKLRVSDLSEKQATFHFAQKQTKTNHISRTSCSNKRNKSNLALKDKQILMNNFLLGKRIIQTPSVINFKKSEVAYNKQRELLNTRNEKFRHSKNKTFRDQKLRQYAINSYKMNKNFRLKSSNKYNRYRQIIKVYQIGIKPLKCHNSTQRYAPLKDFCIKMRYPDHKPKKGQISEIINIQGLQNYTFYFGFNERNLVKKCSPQKQNRTSTEEPIDLHLNFDIYQVKGLNLLFYGTFTIEYDKNQIYEGYNFESTVLKHDKPINLIEGRISVDLKKNIV